MRTRKRPSRTKFSRAEAPLGAVRERDAGNGQLVCMVKVRMDGPTGTRWIPYAKWWWEKNRGPVPKGSRVCHADGDLLNDTPENLVVLTAGEVFKLYHRLDPEMSRRNRAACGAAASHRNRLAGEIRRATTFLREQWYAIDLDRRVVHDQQPRRNRWQVYADHGFAERLAERLRTEVVRAHTGDVDAAAYVLDQAEKLSTYWRWIRSASLGWPGLNCMTACILHVLASAGHPLWTCELLEDVTSLRGILGWNPHRLTVGVLSSCASAKRSWIRSVREGPRMTRWEITHAGKAARVQGPRIVAIRGRDLTREHFRDFKRASASNAGDEKEAAA